MKNSPKKLKKIALTALSGRWIYAIMNYFIYYFVNIAISALFNSATYSWQSISITQMLKSPSLFVAPILIYILLNLFVMILLSPFKVGLNRCWLVFVAGKVVSPLYMFSKPERWLVTMKAQLLRILMLGAVAFVPLFLTITENPYANIAVLVFMVPFFWIFMNYSLTFFILAENDSISALEALKKSRLMMKGRKWHYINLVVSFIPWIFLSFITFGIGLIFLEIYFMVTMTCLYINIKNTGSIDVTV
ncbi:MAG: DUF975 family protein [Clostridia bacterium]|nr:DUF975 family protein [Clostridia bacterium]